MKVPTWSIVPLLPLLPPSSASSSLSSPSSLAPSSRSLTALFSPASLLSHSWIPSLLPPLERRTLSLPSLAFSFNRGPSNIRVTLRRHRPADLGYDSVTRPRWKPVGIQADSILKYIQRSVPPFPQPLALKWRATHVENFSSPNCNIFSVCGIF